MWCVSQVVRRKSGCQILLRKATHNETHFICALETASEL